MQARYYLPTATPTAKASPPNYTPLIIAGLVFVLFFQWQNGDWPFQEQDGQDPFAVIDNTPIDDNRADPTPSPAPNEAKVAWVIVVDESENRPADRQFVFNDYGFWFEELPDSGVSHRWFDVDDKAAETFIFRAKASQVQPPFVMAVGENGSVSGVIPFPEKSVDSIRDMLK